MENKKVQNAAEKQTVVLDAKIILGEYENEKKEKVQYVGVELPDPFDDVDFVHVGIAPRWDRDKAHIKFYGKKALRTAPEIPFKIELRPVTYKSKKTGRDVTYAGLFANSPFNPEYEMEFAVKGQNAYIFPDFANPLLGIAAESGEVVSAADDIGL